MLRSRNVWVSRVSAGCLLVVLGARIGSANFVAITSPSVALTGIGSYTLGYEFQTGPAPYSVLALGVWDEATGVPFLSAAHEVGIYNTSGTLLTSTFVPASAAPSNQIGQYAYAYLAVPLTLTANTDYILVTESASDDAFHGSNFGPPDATWPVFTTPEVNYVNRFPGLLGAGNTITFPAASGSGDSAWDAPNFIGAPVPEPASIALFAVGAACLLVRGSRRIR